jgi:hypothetical protein
LLNISGGKRRAVAGEKPKSKLFCSIAVLITTQNYAFILKEKNNLKIADFQLCKWLPYFFLPIKATS